MSPKTSKFPRYSPRIAVRASGFLALFGLVPVASIAQAPRAAGGEAHGSAVSLANLDLSTPAGVSAARDRVHQNARQQCFQAADGWNASHSLNFDACVDAAVADELRQIDASSRAAIIAPGEWNTQTAGATRRPSSPTAPDTLVMVVSMANLDLSTPDGARMAHDRVKRTALRICRQLVVGRNSAEVWHYEKCVDDATAAAFRQVRSPAFAANADAARSHIEMATSIGSAP